MKRLTYKTLKVSLVILLAVGIGGGFRDLYKRYKTYKAASVEEMVKDATVKIIACPYKNQCGSGTGFVIGLAEHGAYIVTNKHVCANAALKPEDRKAYGQGMYNFSYVEVEKRNGGVGPGQVLRVSQNSDLCLIYAKIKFKKALKIAKSYKMKQVVSSYGFPQGGPINLRGIIKKHDVFLLGVYNESNMLAWYGISGAAVVNEDGEVVGVISNLLSSAKTKEEFKDRSKVYGSLFIPLEILREFLGGN